MNSKEIEKQVLNARFMLCTADHAGITIVNLPILFGKSVPCFHMFFIAMLSKKLCALVATEDWMLKLPMKT